MRDKAVPHIGLALQTRTALGEGPIRVSYDGGSKRVIINPIAPTDEEIRYRDEVFARLIGEARPLPLPRPPARGPKSVDELPPVIVRGA